MYERKGHLNILKLMKKLRERGTRVLCVLIGDGQERERLENFAEQNQIDNVIFAGYRRFPHALIEHCDIFLHLPNEEGFGLVVCEAMRERKLVLASRLGGIEEIVSDGVNGFLVPPDSLEVQSRAFDKMMNLSSTQVDEMLEKAFNRFSDNFAIDIMLRKYGDLYRRILFSA